jgi:ferredoxin
VSTPGGAHADAPRHPVTLMPSGWRFDAPEGTTLWKAARDAGIDLPRSCMNGTCRTCLCERSEGALVHRVEWPGLSADERAQGALLPCVAEARGPLVVWQAAARRREAAGAGGAPGA